MAKDIQKKDLYLLLGVEENASEKAILKGYRRRALKCHPDKNPDNPNAAAEFHELSLALEVLTDVAARAAYDRSRKAKKEVEARNKVLDSKRKKFKEDLEAREQAAEKKFYKVSEADAEKKLQFEIERLRKEGSRLLEQEQSRLRDLLKTSEQAENNKGKNDYWNDDIPRMKLKWKSSKTDANNGGYNETFLSDIFSCYGRVNTILVSRKKNGSAIVEFESCGVSSDILDETGLSNNPLSIVWLSGKPSANSYSEFSFVDNDKASHSQRFDINAMSSVSDNEGISVNFASSSDSGYPSYNSIPGTGPGTTFPCGDFESAHSQGQQNQSSDFENLVLRKMRQAEERKRLIEQMAKEDEDNG